MLGLEKIPGVKPLVCFLTNHKYENKVMIESNDKIGLAFSNWKWNVKTHSYFECEICGKQIDYAEYWRRKNV